MPNPAIDSDPSTSRPLPSIQLLGPFVLLLDETLVRVTRRKQRALLALLAVRANRTVSVAQIAEALWDGAPPARFRNQVHVHVSTIRRLLGDGAGDAPSLETDPDGYRLSAPPVLIDVHRFERAAEEGMRCLVGGHIAKADRLFDSAISLWRGAPLEGIDGAFAMGEAARLEEERLIVQLKSFDIGLMLTRHQELIPKLLSATAENPLHEGLWHRLMLALYGAGRSAEALAAYRRARAAIVSELGIEPGEELRVAEAAVLRREPPGSLVSRTILPSIGARPSVFGSASGSAEVPMPEPVGSDFGAAAAPTAESARRPAAARRPSTAPGTEHGPASTPVAWPIPRQLPPDVVGFTGRKEHLQQLDDTLEEAAALAPVVICGTAGVGKTALAVHWAHRVSHRFTDGQLYLSLRGFRDGPPLTPMAAITQCLRALGISAEEIPTDPQAAAGLYRSLLARTSCLILLDDAASAEQVRPLLPGSPTCKVLITSRYQLTGLAAADGATLLPVGVLSPTESIELFIRAGARQAQHEPEPARTLAQLCAFLPIALRVSAANLAAQPNRSIAEHVTELVGRDRLAALSVEGDNELAMAVVFEHSYSRIGRAARRMFRLIGSSPGRGMTVEQAAVLADVSEQEAADLLGVLVRAHLVEETTSGRHVMHDLLRLYAGGLAQAPEAAAESEQALARFYGWVEATVDEARKQLYPDLIALPPRHRTRAPRTFGNSAEALGWLDAEHPTLVAVIGQAARTPAQAATAWHVADGMRGFFWLSRDMPDWLTAARSALCAARAARDIPGQASAMHSLALAEHARGKLNLALGHYRCAYRLSSEIGWWDGAAAAMAQLGTVHASQGRLRVAQYYLNQSVSVGKRSAEYRKPAAVVAKLGMLYRDMGRLPQAAQAHREAIELYRESGSRLGEGYALGVLGEICHAMGRHAEAGELLRQALALHRELGNRTAEVVVTAGLATLLADSGSPEEALEHARQAAQAAERFDNEIAKAVALNRLAAIELRLGLLDDARDGFERALAATRGGRSRYEEVCALLGLAGVERAAGRLEEADREAWRAFDLARTAEFQLLEADALVELALTALAGDAARDAEQITSRAVPIYQRCGAPVGEATARALLSWAKLQPTR